MDFTIGKEQLLIKKAVIEFARQELNNQEYESFSKEKWIKCAEFGLLGLNINEEYGGMEMDFVSSAIMLQALGYGCEDSGFIFAITNHLWVCQEIVNKYGSNKLKKKYLRKMVEGKYIGCFAVTEPDTGSDIYNMITYATEDDKGYILNGNKMFISNGPIADVFVVIAITNENEFNKKYTAFIVEKDYEGVIVGHTIEKMGLKACPMSELSLVNCRVSPENILFEVNKGDKVVNYALQMERIFEFASHIGSMERLMEKGIQYINQREQYNQKIKNYQSISNKIVEIKVKIELAQLYLYKVAWMVDKGKKPYLDASILKLFISESYIQTCLDIIQIHGAYGYCTEYGIERELRDSIASTIYSGTSEIQRNIIFKLIDIL